MLASAASTGLEVCLVRREVQNRRPPMIDIISDQAIATKVVRWQHKVYENTNIKCQLNGNKSYWSEKRLDDKFLCPLPLSL